MSGKPQKKKPLPENGQETVIEIGQEKDPSSGWLPEGAGDRAIFLAASLGLCAVLHLLFFHNPNAMLTESNVIAKIRTEKMVRRRHAKTLSWQAIQGEEKIFLRDIVYVPKDTVAFVTFLDGKTLELKPDSMVQFDETSVDGIEITLFDLVGFQITPYPKITRSVFLENPRPLELRHSEFSDRLTEHLQKNLNLSKFKPLKPSELVLNRLSDYDLVLIKPENKVYDISRNRWLQHLWTPIPLTDVKFELHTSLDPKFRRFQSQRPKAYKLIVQFDKPGEYFWRVKATRGTETLFSNVGSFTISEGRGTRKRTFMVAPETSAPSTPNASSNPSPSP